jgi:hypothetical protein
MYLDRYKYPKKTFFEFFFIRFLGVFVPVPNAKKFEIFLGFSTGTKSEKSNFYSSNFLNSPLVPVLNPKSTSFSDLLPVQRPQEIEEKNSKKVFCYGYLYQSKYHIFGPKIFLKNFGAAFGTW